MNKILNYIKNGRGLGLKFLLLFSLIVSVIFSFEFKTLGDRFVPEMQNIADKLLPVKVEKGVIVEPSNEIKSIDVNFDGLVVPIVLDTTVDTIDPIGLKPGIYIARKALYSINGRDIRVYDFPSDMDLPTGNYINLFKKIILITSIVLVLVAWIILFIGYVFCTILYAFCAQLIAKVKKLPLGFAAAMRLAVTAYIPTLLLVMILGLLGLNPSFGLTSVAVLVLESIIMSAALSEKTE